ncbi:MAG: hypothetical protein IPP90_02025 [Gemmatimonadaceae bacterium]|nr:hypothetical protein [Gemmatimonadaceae bacterium]
MPAPRQPPKFRWVFLSTARIAAPPLHPSALARRWAVVALGATLLSGAWLRAAIAWPSLAGGINVLFGVHAHSHVAFFGWVVLAVASIAARQVTWTARSMTQWRWLVHALGVLAIVALVAFAYTGYAAPTIALSAVHVLLWIPLVRLAWPLHLATAAERAWWRVAWMALLAAGTATLIPGVLAARGIRDGWWREFGIKLFLALFLNGFAGLSAMGLLAASGTLNARQVRWGAWARRAIAASLLPLAILYVAAPPPMPGLVWVGRAAVGIVGAGTLLVVILAWPRPQAGWTRLAIPAFGIAGVLEIMAATGVGSQLMHDRPITIAFTHLMLLLAVSPILAATLAWPRVAVRRPVIAACGAGAMCAALAAYGWPWLGAHASAAGLGPMQLLTLAALGGLLAAGAWLSLLPLLFGAHAPEEPV